MPRRGIRWEGWMLMLGLYRICKKQPCTRSLSARKSKRGESQNSHYSCYKSNAERNETKPSATFKWMCGWWCRVLVLRPRWTMMVANGMAGGPISQLPRNQMFHMVPCRIYRNMLISSFCSIPDWKRRGCSAASSWQVAPINYIN